MKTIRYILIISFLIIFGEFIQAQNIAINTTGAAPDASAILDIQSNTKGLLIPRMDEVARNNIAYPTTGLWVYQTDGVAGFWYFNGTSWANIDEAVNIFVSDGSLAANRNLTQDDNNLVFQTGIGKTIIDGHFHHAGGALYAKPPRVITTPSPIVWSDSDVLLFLSQAYSGTVNLPSASAAPNRVVGINNRQGGIVSLIRQTDGGPPVDNGVYFHEAVASLASTVGMVYFISDGISWRLYDGRPVMTTD